MNGPVVDHEPRARDLYGRYLRHVLENEEGDFDLASELEEIRQGLDDDNKFFHDFIPVFNWCAEAATNQLLREDVEDEPGHARRLTLATLAEYRARRVVDKLG